MGLIFLGFSWLVWVACVCVCVFCLFSVFFFREHFFTYSSIQHIFLILLFLCGIACMAPIHVVKKDHEHMNDVDVFSERYDQITSPGNGSNISHCPGGKIIGTQLPLRGICDRSQEGRCCFPVVFRTSFLKSTSTQILAWNSYGTSVPVHTRTCTPPLKFNYVESPVRSFFLEPVQGIYTIHLADF